MVSKYTAKSLLLILCLSEGFGIQRFGYEEVKRTLSVNIEMHFQAAKLGARPRWRKVTEIRSVFKRISAHRGWLNENKYCHYITKLNISRNTVIWVFENVVIVIATMVMDDLMKLVK